MRISHFMLAITLAGGIAVTPASAGKPAKPLVAAAASTDRPEADRVRDADRKPVETMAFAGVKPGATIIELAPGGGYYTRLLSLAVGPKGKVYPRGSRISAAVEEWAKTHPNTLPAVTTGAAAYQPAPVDMVWTTQNYHDFANAKVGEKSFAQVTNELAFAALKPGGIYLINDHDAAKGAGLSVTSTLHRIEAAAVIKEVEAAGFVLDASSDILRHPADDHTMRVVESGIRGKTDQFVLRFRKPRR